MVMPLCELIITEMGAHHSFLPFLSLPLTQHVFTHRFEKIQTALKSVEEKIKANKEVGRFFPRFAWCSKTFMECYRYISCLSYPSMALSLSVLHARICVSSLIFPLLLLQYSHRASRHSNPNQVLKICSRR